MDLIVFVNRILLLSNLVIDDGQRRLNFLFPCGFSNIYYSKTQQYEEENARKINEKLSKQMLRGGGGIGVDGGVGCDGFSNCRGIEVFIIVVKNNHISS